jgi:Fe-S-cluster containining protein
VLEKYRELAAKVDAFFARVEARHAADLRCAVGCDRCCHARLTVTAVEADVIVELIADLDAASRARLHALASRPVSPRCAALDDDGRCSIYAARPIVCRSHGVPIRLRAPGSLPVIQACELNFTAHGPAAADADCVLDQATLSATLLAIDRAHAEATEREPGERYDLAEVLLAALEQT